MRVVVATVILISSIGPKTPAGTVDEVPEAFAPFEHMIGGWKGTASPTVNRVKGWPESHGWAWKFEKGVPVGMSLTLEGDKTIAKGLLTFDPAAKKYHLDGSDPGGKPIAFLGAFSPDGKALTLDRVGVMPEGKERLVIRPNSNKIRYTLQLDRQEKGAPQFKGVVAVGLSKDGESFAAGGAESNLPKCVLTGGAASMSVSYMGKTFPVCCSGCRDEFNENPEKYARKAEAMAQAIPAPVPPIVTEAEASKTEQPLAPRAEAPKAKNDAEAKATRALGLGQTFERNGKKSIALDHYRKVVKDYPTTRAARLAGARIKALGSP